MPHARARLDLHLLVTPADRALEDGAADATWSLGVARGWWRPDGQAGADAHGLVAGGFEQCALERFDRVRLVANQQGGFRVRCPQCGVPLAAPFGRAVQAWREGGARSLTCPSCGWVGPLEAVPLAPPGGFARAWLRLVDVAEATVVPAALQELERCLGPVRQIARRPG